MNERDGGPVFPLQAKGHVEEPEGAGSQNLRFTLTGGMSLRDWFAGQALNGMCSSSSWPNDRDAPELSRRAYVMADAMLVARTPPDVAVDERAGVREAQRYLRTNT